MNGSPSSSVPPLGVLRRCAGTAWCGSASWPKEKHGLEAHRQLWPAVRASLVKHGGEPMSMTQPDFTRFVLAESESAARIIEAAGVKPQ